jgi:OmpA-OmpF porin, OOP family
MKKILRVTLICLLAGLTLNAAGQINLKDKLKKTVSKATQGMGNVLKKDDSQQNKQEQQQQQQTKQEEQPQQQGHQENNNPVQQATAQPQTELQAYSKYDFIPGSKVIFYEDFSQDAIGDFPALWNTNGSGEVVTTNLYPGKWLKFESNASVWTDQLLDLPENYTVELDIIPLPEENGNARSESYTLMLYQCINVKAFDYSSRPGKVAFNFYLSYGVPNYSTYINLPGGENMGLSGNKDGESFRQKPNQKYHIAIWMQKARVRLYQGQDKLFDLPKAFNLEGVKMDRIRFDGGAFMVTNIRVAVGAPDTRNKLLTEGKLVTYGIYFDVNKDVVKPESYGTLKDIAAVLSENPDVRVKIVGHTDSDGADAANLELSKKRAASVKDEMVKTFTIDASRIETDGMGETKPVVLNDTPVNKALNRRVEFIKL